MIQSEAFRCKEITEKLLDFSRHRASPSGRTTDLGELVQGVIEMIGHLGKYQQKRIEFAARQAGDRPGQPAGDQAGGAEPADQRPGQPGRGRHGAGRLSARDGLAELTFPDNGCGMEPEVLDHVFEPFFTRRREGRGPAWDSRSPSASSPTTAARSTPRAPGRAAARPSASVCRWPVQQAGGPRRQAA